VRFYTGIGSRSTPSDQLKICTQIATDLEKMGFILRSGGAEGADSAFESGVSNPKNKIILRPKHSTPDAEQIASQIHPAWFACNDYARKLHGRNVQLILGERLNEPSEFVIAWTFDGQERGGTRTGLVVAKQKSIPTFNLANADEAIKFAVFLVTLRG
jgi:hypothetical protein